VPYPLAFPEKARKKHFKQCGSVLKLLPLIRIRTVLVQMVSIKEKNLKFQVKKSIAHFAAGLIVLI